MPSILFGAAICLFIGGFLGAATLRGVCSLFNNWFGEIVETADAPIETSFSVKRNSEEPDEPRSLNRPYSSPTVPLSVKQRKNVVPEPSFGKSCFVCIAASIIFLMISTTLAYFFERMSSELGDAPTFFAWLFSNVLVSFLVLSWLIKRRLPTTYRRAFGVAALFLLTGLVMVGFLLGSIVLAAWFIEL